MQDHLGSTVGLSNAGGAVSESNSYDSFGNPANPDFSSRYQFTGREFDGAAGLQYSRARWYDPNIGRFISEDPIGFGGGDINLYGYASNNPLNFSDPFGLDAVWDQQVWRAQQDVLEALEQPIAAAVGFGNGAGFGVPRIITTRQGNDTVNWDCYPSYIVADYVGEIASMLIPAGAIGKATGISIKIGRYAHGGGGINFLRNGVRKFAIDYHKFKSEGQMVEKLHFHWGRTKNQMRKHRNIFGKPY